MKKMLFLGPVTNVNEGLVGGATTSFGQLTDYFEREKWPVKILNTKKYFGFASSLRNTLYIIANLSYLSIWADVIFVNSSRGGTKHLAPLSYLLAKIFRKKFVFRPFGGDIAKYTQDYGNAEKWVFRKTILRSDIFYLQTQALIDYYKDSEANIKQLRTSRKKHQQHLQRVEHEYTRKFIFLGFVNEAKGINHILEAAEQLGAPYTIHIYGPIKEKQFEEMNPYIYKGVLNKSEVLKTMSKYDVLLLPTFYEGEGHPGAIIEAYSIGLPVIATAWGAIPEIIKDGDSGLVIKPRSTKSLITAMEKIDHENYEAYAENALQYFNDTFDEEIVLGQVKKDILAL